MTVKVAVIYYSATGAVHALAQAVAEGAASAGAGVRLRLGALIVPPGFTDPVVYAAGGNPYGTSFATGPTGDGPDAAALEAARYQGRRLAQITTRLLGGGRVTDAAADDGNARETMAATASHTA